MKLMNENMENLSILGSKGSFNFSAVKIEDLGATEYTLVTIAIDKSGSVSSFKAELLEALKSVIDACKKSPRAENLMIRVIEFNQTLQEVHGFKLLNTINTQDYTEPDIDGMTALFDATYSSVGATISYSKNLTDQDFNVNGICFIITDGYDNSSKTTPTMIKKFIDDSKKGEVIESLITILIGINSKEYFNELDDFKKDADLNQFIDVGQATPQKLAKLATFVSKSISSQSQVLGSGGPSQPLTF